MAWDPSNSLHTVSPSARVLFGFVRIYKLRAICIFSNESIQATEHYFVTLETFIACKVVCCK